MNKKDIKKFVSNLEPNDYQTLISVMLDQYMFSVDARKPIMDFVEHMLAILTFMRHVDREIHLANSIKKIKDHWLGLEVAFGLDKNNTIN